MLEMHSMQSLETELQQMHMQMHRGEEGIWDCTTFIMDDEDDFEITDQNEKI